jgi:hypothetical protein
MTQAVQHVGVTRSGKAIQVAIFSDEQQFELPVACTSYTPVDHVDAYLVFESLISRELRRRPVNTRMLDLYERMSNAHNSKVNRDCKQVERLSLGMVTIFNVLEHRKSLADRVFKD